MGGIGNHHVKLISHIQEDKYHHVFSLSNVKCRPPQKNILNVKERLFEQKLVEREDEKKGVGQYD
jgi:hypothetical protein